MNENLAPSKLDAIASALSGSCHKFATFFQELLNAKADEKDTKRWVHLLIAEGHPEAAIELIKGSAKTAGSLIL